MINSVRVGIAAVCVSALLWSQQAPAPPPGFGPRVGAAPVQGPQPAPAKPAPATPGQTPAAQAPAGQTPAAQVPAAAPPAGPATVYGGVSLQNASLTEVIENLARELKLNYVL